MPHRRSIPFGLALGAMALIAIGSCRDRDLPTGLEPAGVLFSQVATAPVVNSLAGTGDGTCDDAECTLTEAIEFASAGATITFAPGLTGTITATGGTFYIGKSLTIAGPGAGTLTVRAAGEGVFYVGGSGSAEISGLTLAGARSVAPAVSNSGVLTIRHCVVTENTFTGGDAAAVINWAGASLAIIESTIAGNSATGGYSCGGGIRNNGGTLTITGSTISGNTRSGGSYASGGGVCNGVAWSPGTATITNSTVSGNTAGDVGGGIHNHFGSTLTLINSTITGNSAPLGGGGINHGGTLTLTNTLLAGNTTTLEMNGPDLLLVLPQNPTTTASYSLLGSAFGHTIAHGTNGNIVGVAAAALQLGPLADNGGPTRTHALLAGSPALDAGTAAGCPATDQRGTARPQGSACDIGAFEKDYNAPQDPATPLVNSLDDVVDAYGCTDAHCSLREAIALASSAATISFAPALTGTITLTDSLVVDKSLVIQGPGAAVLAVSGNDLVRVFKVSGASTNAQIRGLTLRNGRALSGGGLHVASATVTLDSMVIRNNTAAGPMPFGAGIASVSASLAIRNSTITTNTAPTGTAGMSIGGGIYNESGSLALVNSTVSGNSANSGAGIITHELGNTLSLLNSTISGNTATNWGGGIYGEMGSLSIRYSTVAGNSGSERGAGIYATSSITLRGAIIAGNTGAADLDDWYHMASAQYSLIGTSTGHWIVHGTNGNLVGVDPLLGALADNGGLTDTRALNASSPAIDQIPEGTIGCGTDPVADQRGVTRPRGAACDMGSFEREAGALQDPGTPVVNTLDDVVDGVGCTPAHCSLREAIAHASSGGTITFAPGLTGTITLVGGQLSIADKSLTITGPGASVLAVSGNGTSRVFNLSGSSDPHVAFSGLTITGGRTSDIGGAGILITSVTVTITDCALSGNDAAGTFGGAIRNAGGSLLVRSTTFSGNTAGSTGAIYNNSARAITIRNSTISGNSSPAIRNTLGTVHLEYSTVTGHTTGVFTTADGLTHVKGSILAGNTTDVDAAAAGRYSSNGYNLVGTGSAAVSLASEFSATGDQRGVTTPGLGSLDLNTPGTTRTHALIAGSPAIDAIPGGFCADLATDQRGVSRPQGSACDIGAYEKEGGAGLLTPTFTFDLASLPAKYYGAPPFSVTSYVTTNSSGAVTFALGAGSAGCSVSSAGEVTINAAATGSSYCVIEATLAPDGTYAGAGPIGQQFHVARTTTTVSITNMPTSAVVGDSFTPSFTTTSDGATSTLSTTPAVCSVDGSGVVHFDAPGSCGLQSSVTEGTNWTAATGIVQSVEVAAGLVFGFDLSSLPAKTYGDEPFSVAGYVTTNSSGSVTFDLGAGSVGCSVTAAGDVTITGAATGSSVCILAVSLGAAAPYGAAGPVPQQFNIARAALDVTAENRTITYGAATPALAVQYDGFVGADNAASLGGALGYTFAGISPTVYSPSTTAPTNAGTYSITPAGYSSTNYVISYFQGTYTIDKAPGSVTITNLPASGVFGGSFMPTFTRAGDGTASVASLTTPVCTVSTVVNYVAVGQCTLQPYVTEGTNHLAAAGTPQSFSVGKAPQALLTVDGPINVTYGSTHSLAATGGTGTGAVSFSVGASTGCAVAGTTLSVTDASGSCAVTATRAADDSHDAITSDALTATLNKAAQATLTLVDVPASAPYNSSFTVTPGGGSGSQPLVVSTSGACSNVGNDVTMTSGTGTCTVAVNRAGDTNYDAAGEVTASASATKIAQATLDVTGPASLTYGAAAAPVTTSGGSGAGAVVFSIDGSTGCALGGAGLDQLSVTAVSGSCAVTATKAADDNYAGATSTAFTVTLDKASTTTTATGGTAIFNSADQTVALAATVTSAAGTVNDGKVTFTVKNGSTVIGAAVEGAVTAGNASADYTLPGGTAPAMLSIEAAYSDGSNFANSNDAKTLTVRPAAAEPEYVGDEWVQANASGSVSVTLRALITDAEVVASSVAGARVTFVDVTSNNAVIGSCRDVRVDITSYGNPSEGIATCVWSFTLSKSETGRTLTVGFVIGGTHKNKGSVASPVATGPLDITRNAPFTMLGAGEVPAPAGSSMWPGAVGDASFNINVKYNNKLTNPQGYAVVTFDVGGVTYQAKSNSLNNFSVHPETIGGTSIFSSKASIARQNEDDTWTSVEGNATLQLHVIDGGAGGDQIAITVSGRDGGLLYSNNWISGRTQPFAISDGNVTINGK